LELRLRLRRRGGALLAAALPVSSEYRALVFEAQN
jgi:hypothetical protein